MPEPARLWTRRRHRLSLRARLLVTLMTLLTAGLLAADIGTIMALNGFLTDRIDKQLTSAASVAVDMTAAGQSLRDISVGGPSDENGAWELLYRDGVELNMLVVRWSNGTQTRQGPPNLPALPAVFPGTAAHPAIFDAADSSGQDYRVISGPLPGGQGTYAIGMSLANLHSTVRSLIGVEVPLSLGVLIIVGAIGVSSVRRGMRPLDAMAVTARRIGDGDLSRRVDRSDDRTEVGRLGAALNDMLTQLESAFEERRASEDRLRRFVADASHELRTPLASVRGYAELFRRGAASRPDDLATAMRRIESEATRMGVLVDEMLLLARLDSGRPLARDQLDLAALGADAASDSMAADGRWPVTVDAPAPVEIVGDTDRLRQVMANLLANLRRHTPPGTSATLRVSYQDPDTALVELADTGPGMTAEQAGLVFERFYRGDAARTRRGDGGGAGLGLSIVAAIAHAHGGTATLRTAPGAGATFAVTLPVAGPDPDRATATATGAPVSESGVERPRHRDDPQLTAGSQLGHRAGAAESGAVVADNVTTTSEEPTTMHRLSDFVIKHRRLIGLVWLLSLLAGGFASSLLTSRLDQTFNIPGQRSYTANQNIAKVYGNGGSNDPFVPVVTAPAGTRVTDPAVYAGLDKAFTALGAKPGYRVVDYTNTGNPAFLSADHRTTFAIVYPPVHFDANGLPRIQGSATDISTLIRGDLPLGSEVLTTGTTPLANAGSNGTKGIGVLGEVVVGGLGALAVLAFVFASLLALVPLMVAAVSVTTAFLIILGLTTFTDISQIVQYMVGLIGLGVAIDYSLLLVTRWREELGRGADNETAVRRAMLTAGRSVVFSGITVAVGLLVLVALPVPFMRSIGFGGMLIPLVSVLATLTLVPVLLLGAGRRMSWPNRRHEEQPARGWTAWGRFVVRRRWIAAGGALGVLAVLLVAGTGLKVGDASENALAQHGPARDGLVMLQNAGIPVGVLTPIDVYVPASERPDTVVAAASRVPGVFAAAAPTGSSWRQYQTAMVTVLPVAESPSNTGEATVRHVRDAIASAAPTAEVGGTGAGMVDQLHAFYGNFVLILAALALVTFLLLARAFRSVLLAAKAVLLNLVSVAAAYGVMVLVWQQGHGSHLIWGVPATGAIPAWIPLMVFAFLFGLSMDYEVFILTRMREEYEATGSTTRAVVTGIGRTGRLVTSAALILFLALAALASAPLVDLKVFASALAAGILLDATIVRALLVPALVSLFGRWNWWLPGWLAWLLRVPAAPLPARGERRANGGDGDGHDDQNGASAAPLAGASAG